MKDLVKTIHYRSILGSLGLILQVPALMCLVSIAIAAIFTEWFSIIPLVVVGIVFTIIGQILYRYLYSPKEIHLWDAMITAALGWLFCPLIASFVIYWIMHNYYAMGFGVNDPFFRSYIDCLFEGFSGFTSSGFSMASHPEKLPQTIIWWRSSMQYIGGIGLIVFVISLIHHNAKSYQLFFSEARSEKIGKSITQTSRFIWMIYLGYTFLGIILFWVFGLPFWSAVNLSMTGIATGGFTISHQGFAAFSSSIQVIAIALMILGAMSFSMHYMIFTKGKIWKLFTDSEHRLFFIIVVCGAVITTLFVHLVEDQWLWLVSIFQWVSALATCGFSSVSILSLGDAAVIFLIIGMFIGGCSGSTCGGLKIKRLNNLFYGVFLQMKSVFSGKETKQLTEYETSKTIKKEAPSTIEMPKNERASKLYAANVLFTLLIFIIVVFWIILIIFNKEIKPLNILFDIVSAIGNVGLSAGVVNKDLSTFSKWMYILLMWLGRLEVVPILVLAMAIPSPKNFKKIIK